MTAIIHPATILLLWVICLTVLQWQSLLVLIPLTLLSACLAAWVARVRYWKMLRRIRWLLLSTAILFAWGTPGEFLAALPGASIEGLILATRQILCLLLFITWLCLLLEWLGMSRLITALYTLMAPLRLCGLNRDRAALRLLLVMNYLEQPPPTGGWREWLNQREVAAPLTRVISLPVASLAWLDGALLGAVLLLMLMVLS